MSRGVKVIIVIAILAPVVCFVPEVREKLLGIARSAGNEMAPPPPSNEVGSEVKVFLPRNGEYYHVRDCAAMSGQGVPTALSKAKALAKPCPECRPPL